MKQFLTLLFAFLFSFAYSQTIFNNGAPVAVTNGGLMIVKNGSFENGNTGLVNNAGQIYVEGYFRNNSIANGGNTTGQYIISGNWENNSTFNADQSLVRLVGNNQNITGTQSTTFYDLSLETTSSVKTQTIDASVNNNLNLNDCELATGTNRMSVLNNATSAISRNQGFVSSVGAGRLVRSANSSGTYLFPTGWDINGVNEYRPIEIQPNTNNADLFAVRLYWGDPGNEGYNVNTKAENVNVVNSKFYHNIQCLNSNANANVSVFYDATSDGNWQSLARWQNIPQWQDLAAVNNSSNPFSFVKKSGWVSSSDEPHALISTKEVPLFEFPNAFSPNSDNNNDVFTIINDFNLVSLEEMRVFNRWGHAVYDLKRDGGNGWNGSFQGAVQPLGTYVYTAVVKEISTGKTQTIQGSLSLIH